MAEKLLVNAVDFKMMPTAASFQFMSDNQRRMIASEKVYQTLQTELTALTTALAAFDRELQRSAKDMLTDKIKAADELRDKAYRAWAAIVKGMAICPPSDAMAEAAALLPYPVWENDELFSSLSQPLIGKHYPDREWGLGEVRAKCGEHCLVRFPDGRQELLTLSEMLSRRAAPQLVSRTEALRRQSSPSAPTRPQTTQFQVTVGSRIKHRSFGAGKVLEIRDDVITVAFQKYGTRKMLLSALIEHGLVKL